MAHLLLQEFNNNLKLKKNDRQIKKTVDGLEYVKKAKGGKIVLYTVSIIFLAVGTGLAVYTKCE